MQNLYNSRIANRSRRPSSHNHRTSLSKKQIPKIAAQFTNNPIHIEELLRNLLKVGEDRLSRLVDSTMATDYLYTDYCRDGDSNEQMVRWMLAAQVLTEDALSGGRFKRRSCQFVSAQYDMIDSAATSMAHTVTLVNGGWTAVDPSIKAASEGRKFAAATSSNNENRHNNTSTTKEKKKSKTPLVLTAADERIVNRLECLAFGDGFVEGDGNDNVLELDVREALASMNLPLSSQGATTALIQIGRWSDNVRDDSKSNSNKLIEPWSPELLDAAKTLAMNEDKRRKSLAKKCKQSKSSNNKDISQLVDNGIEGRVDLSSLPCVCIDSKRASFRDDSIGIRLRSSTRRKVNKAASKWEVLIHIADISDIYFDHVVEASENVHLLREAAERRGQSRYDLPLGEKIRLCNRSCIHLDLIQFPLSLGPLHLLPPVALTALSLATNKDNTPNRCVTLWAYIDERHGKLLEAGLERTIISSPRALSFDEATSLLEINADEVPKSMSNTRAILSVAERNLALWNKRNVLVNQSALKREKRLRTREMISNELNNVSNSQQIRDDGVGHSFQRSRGHRMVDSSLDLYASAVGTLMKRAKRPIPRLPSSGADRGGRVATAPLRRYIDGIAQKQALSVLCGYGKPMTLEECKKASKIASRASDNIDNLRSSKQSVIAKDLGKNQQRQVTALYKLARHLSSTGGIQSKNQVKAISTGKNNEVVIVGELS